VIILRNVRGVKNVVKYLHLVGAPMSESTIYNLMRQNKIPHQRPSPRVLIFNLDRIDKWLQESEVS